MSFSFIIPLGSEDILIEIPLFESEPILYTSVPPYIVKVELPLSLRMVFSTIILRRDSSESSAMDKFSPLIVAVLPKELSV